MEELQVQQGVLPPEWNIDSVGMTALRDVNRATKMVGAKGIYAGIPIICKGKNCPFVETCTMLALHTDVETLRGQRCPIEINDIMNLFERYTRQFNIDEDTEDMVQLGLIKELIDYEIQEKRADRKMAAQGDFLEDTVVGISNDGEPIINKDISKAVDYKERITEKKHKILQLLNSTPKDKAGMKVNLISDPSTYAAMLIAKAREIEADKVIEVEPIETQGADINGEEEA